MSSRFACPQGHRWEAPPPTAARAASADHCPVCGAAGQALPVEPGQESRTIPTVALSANSPPADVPTPPTTGTAAAMLTVAQPAHAGATAPTVAGYQILREVGRGGTGVVYKAWHLELKREVALKMVLSGAHAGPHELARFQAEAVARLQHPNIVQVYEVGHQGGRPYLALEYVDGGRLADQGRGAPRPVHEAARLVETLARAVQHAHERGIIHRDLTPGNILLTGDGVPKITDFGLAKFLRVEGQEGQTQTGTILGTPSYMAPEQAGGKVHAIGPATDVYALGAILYDLLAGRPPFQAATPLDTVVQVVTEDPPPLPRLRPGLPRDLETICHKCLLKEPARRYASARDLADDLGRFLRGEPTAARPLGLAPRLFRWVKRRPAAAALVGFGVLTVLLLAVGGLIHNARLRSMNADLQAALEDARTQRDQSERANARAATTLTDMHTSSGLQAGDRSDPRLAPLWFASAARLAAGDPDRARANRARFHAWLR
jgi:eukaryotic-like serine/threonine-protein kinase